MKVIFAAVTISCALPALTGSNIYAQAGRGGGATGGSAVGTSSAAGSGTLRPTGNLATQPGAVNGPVNTVTTTTPSGTPVATPGTATPVGTINPGGLTGIPPTASGRTFERTTIGGGPTDNIITPGETQPTFRFPPSSTLRQNGFTNGAAGGANGFPDAAVNVGGTPVVVGNTVGTNFGGVITSPAREPVAVNLPPGATVRTNVLGVAEAFVPAPAIVPTNGVGRGPTFESSSSRSLPQIQRTAPPRSTPIR